MYGLLRFYVGADQTSTGEATGHSPEELERLITRMLLDTFGGCTVWRAYGSWVGKRQIYTEQTIVGEVLVTAADEDMLEAYKSYGRQAAQSMASALHQESVLYMVSAVDAVEFVAAETSVAAQNAA